MLEGLPYADTSPTVQTFVDYDILVGDARLRTNQSGETK